jgi:membrane-associated phospholipid phosphatase
MGRGGKDAQPSATPFNSFQDTPQLPQLCAVILYARPWLGTVAFASLIGWSSIMVGTHHPSDVIASICISLFVVWFTWKWTKENGEDFARRIRMKLRPTEQRTLRLK